MGSTVIAFNAGAKPYALSVPRLVPIALLPKVKAERDRMERSKIISRLIKALTGVQL